MLLLLLLMMVMMMRVMVMVVQWKQGHFLTLTSTVERMFLSILTQMNIPTTRPSKTRYFRSSGFPRSQVRCALRHFGHIQSK